MRDDCFESPGRWCSCALGQPLTGARDESQVRGYVHLFPARLNARTDISRSPLKHRRIVLDSMSVFQHPAKLASLLER